MSVTAAESWRWRCQLLAAMLGSSWPARCCQLSGRHSTTHNIQETAAIGHTARTKEVTRRPRTLTRGLETRREGEAARASGEQAREAAGGCGGQEAADHVLG